MVFRSHGSYCPEVVIALIVKALYGTVPSNDGKWSRDVPEFPQDNSIGPICYLEKVRSK